MSKDRKSSATAKTALGLAIGGLGLAAVQGGLLGGTCCENGCGGGLLNLFGNRNCRSAYEMEKADKGAAAVTEMNMLEKWIMPMMGQICDIKTNLAVNSAVDEKNQIINNMMFQMSANKTDAAFELSKTRTDAAFALSKAQTEALVQEATCGMIKGTPYLSPCQMADPYQAGTNVLLSRHYNAAVPTAVNYNTCGCGCDGSSWTW